MYSNANNQYSNISILSIKEIIGLVIVFSFVLYLLFPKGDIESLIQGEHENTNLSINYLESMLLYHPDNVDLQMLLIQNYRYKGELEKASQLNDKLIATTTKKELLKQLYQHEYLILKEKYFQLENNPE
ncbi:MAG: hypothetical protein K0U38_02325, partial [Epsilonproteobacteria bacterium]|nr:hypothetical protein [Campylobacterota bacterium]